MVDNQTLFKPVYGTEERILQLPIVDGYVYFASDSGKIFLDAEGERKSFGGNGSGIALYYAEQETVEQDGNDYYIIFPGSVISEGISLRSGDLIINIDGAFYKVVDLNEDNNYICTRIAISGSGGGEGGGGVITKPDTRIIYDNRAFSNSKTYIYNQDNYIEFTLESDVDDEIDLSIVISQNGKLFGAPIVDYVANGDTYRFNTAKLPKGDNITVAVNATSTASTMPNGANVTKQRITTVELSMSKDTSFNTTAIQTAECGIGFKPTNNGLTQQLHVLIDGSELDLSASQSNKGFLAFKPNGNIYTVMIPRLNHGTHTIQMYVSTVISDNTMTSNAIVYEVAWRDSEDTTPVIWVGEYSSTAIQYNEIVIPFMVYNPATEIYNQTTKVYLTCNGVEIPTSPIQVKYDANNWIRWDVTNLVEAGPDEGRENNLIISCGSTSRKITFRVTTEGSRDLGLVNENALVLNLVSTGRSNSETTNSRENWGFGSYNTEFTNFNWYNNGWLNDNDGNGSYLSVANGASARINLSTYSLNQSNDYSFEIRFRVRNIQEYSTLIRTIPRYWIVEDPSKSYTVAEIKANGYTYDRDEDGNTRMDAKGSEKIISTTAGVIFSYLNSQGYGFCIGTQEAYFKTPASIANVRYKEDEIINLSFIVSNTNKLLSIYLNGILSGALDLSSDLPFSMDNDCFLINSEFCDIDIYKIRIYRAELSMPDVIHNYISDIHNIDLYDQNQLTDEIDGTILEYYKVVKFNEDIAKYNADKDSKDWKEYSMPYAVWEIIDNGTGINDPNKGVHGSDDDKLPYFKGNDRYCKITFVNPTLDAALEAGKINEEFYYSHSPSYIAIGAEINVQGTSSQAYPRRNMKTKMKSASSKKDADDIKHDDWGWYFTKGSRAGENFSKWNMDNYNCSTNAFTWKIDYMESSGTYNTGFANLVGNSMYDYHPLSKIPALNNNGTGYRTSVYGFPVLVFHKHSTDDDRNLSEADEYQAYEFIGRYNLNLDKSSNEFYGFEVDGNNPFVTVKNDENPSGQWFSNKEKDVAECWELRNNQGTWTSWKYPNAADRITKFGTTTTEGTLEAIKHFEVRYNSESKAIEAACKSGDDATQTSFKGSGRTIDLSTLINKTAYLREKMSNLERLFDWLDSTDTTVVSEEEATDLPQPVTYHTTVYYMVETFRENGQDIAYYVDSTGEKLVKCSDLENGVDVDGQNYFVYMQDDENIMTRALTDENYVGTKRAKDDILITYTKDTPDYRLKKFVAEFSQHLDLEYCLVYFILTELLLCYDSRGKNMMIASWGPQEEGGDYIWYPIFYDIDTQLGLNNIGAVLWDYDTDATLEGTFSTANSVLWLNFFAGFRPAIENKYRTLRSGSRLTEQTIEGAYLCDPKVFATSYAMRGVRPVIALGLDEWTKYISCGIKNDDWYKGRNRRYGFYVRSYENGKEKTTDASYVYTCQGDRKLSRELFIRNRLNYLDSWWLAGAYDSNSSGYKTEIMIRANANDTSTSDTYLDSSKIATDVSGYTRAAYPVDFYDATPWFEITPFLAQYVTVFYDEDPLTPTIKFDGTNAVETHTTPSVENGYRAIHPYNEQLTYIPGGDFLSDLGDLSLKYPSHFKLTTGKRLVDLRIGSDAPGYFNGIIGEKSGTFDLNDSASVTNKKGLLQRIILTGLTALNLAQDVTGSEKLREFRALNTKIPYVIFADGAPLDTVHLPLSTINIKLVYALNMKKMLRNAPAVMIEQNGTYVYNDHDNYEGLYIEGLTDWNKPQTLPMEDGEYVGLSKVNTINFSNVALGYNSFIILDNAIDIRERFRPDGYLALNLENVEWSPYKEVEIDEEYINSKTFYRLTDHNTFVTYQHNSADEWNRLKANKKIFILDENEPKEIISSTEDLDIIIEDYIRATGVSSNHYRNVTPGETKTLPSITGIIYIDNSDENAEAISETSLQDHYKQYFPDLKIYAAKVTESYISKFVQDLGNGIEEEVDLIRTDKVEGAHCSLTSTIPTKTNYNFQGWTQDPSLTEIEESDVVNYISQGKILTSASDFESLLFSAEKDTYTFYAVFSIASYTIQFKGALVEDDDISTQIIRYGEYLADPGVLVTTKAEENLSDTERYKFLGWVTDRSFCFPRTASQAKIVKLGEIMVQADRVFYPCFVAEDATLNITDLKYFRFIGNGIGYTVEPVDISKAVLFGKISIPTTYLNLPVTIINNFNGQRVTHVYWVGEDNLRIIDSSCFRYMTTLKYFQFPTTLETISSFAFQGCSNLAVPQDGFASLTSLRTLGQLPFGAAFSALTTGLGNIHLPGSLTSLNQGSFANFNVASGENVGTLQIGGPGDPSQINSLSTSGIFRLNGGAYYGAVTVYIRDGVSLDETTWRTYIENPNNMGYRANVTSVSILPA